MAAKLGALAQSKLRIARRVCQNCHNLVCREHLGKGDWCDLCTQSARVGNWLATGIVAAVLGVSVLFLLLSQSPALR